MWLGPALLGIVLILIGFAIFIAPQLLAYFVASVFIFAGISMLGFAFAARRRVSFRRLDDDENTIL